MASSSPGAVAAGPDPAGVGPRPAAPGGSVGGPIGGPAAQLRAAAARGELQEVVRLLGEGTKLLPDEEGRTALHFSASAGHADIAAALIIAGAGVNATDS
ncbi:ankyrin repeat domain-containing protein 54-like, partial [Frankliniella occidentalis]|uniref:Ankyrin repeat domain-containing protein 54-like n=1 Tax=Frankliniella occidentalis TaxID=133901 RepID=A0A9C6XA52_FRAOC